MEPTNGSMPDLIHSAVVSRLNELTDNYSGRNLSAESGSDAYAMGKDRLISEMEYRILSSCPVESKDGDDDPKNIKDFMDDLSERMTFESIEDGLFTKVIDSGMNEEDLTPEVLKNMVSKHIISVYDGILEDLSNTENTFLNSRFSEKQVLDLVEKWLSPESFDNFISIAYEQVKKNMPLLPEIDVFAKKSELRVA